MYGLRANLLKIKDESFRAAREFWDAQKKGKRRDRLGPNPYNCASGDWSWY
jgi:hypothetical protein